MKKFLFIAAACALGLVFSSSDQSDPSHSSNSPQVVMNEEPSCPDDNCPLTYTGKDKFCVGVNCRHVKIYRCGCCSKEWGVYQDQ
jgi:hypothetical protein